VRRAQHRPCAGRLFRDRRGASAAEFALVGPLLLILIFCVIQLGVVFLAQSGVKHAVGQAARFATIYPRPSDNAIIAKMTSDQFGLNSSRILTKTVSHGTTASGAPYADITLNYRPALILPIGSTPLFEVNETRRVYLQ
jgi:Flp pilus assembly protein TadG